MARRKKKRNGVGAKCSVLLKRLHPRKDIQDKYPNATAQQRLSDLLVIGKATKKVTRRDQEVTMFRHSNFEGKELYIVHRWVTVEEESPDSRFCC